MKTHLMNPISNLLILSLLFSQAALAESKENSPAHTIPVVEKSLQPSGGTLKPAIQSEAKSFPLDNATVDKKKKKTTKK